VGCYETKAERDIFLAIVVSYTRILFFLSGDLSMVFGGDIKKITSLYLFISDCLNRTLVLE
jgi:hypothetical protein